MSVAPPTTPLAPDVAAPEQSLFLPLPRSWRAWLQNVAQRNFVGLRGLAITGGSMAAIYLLLTLAFPITSWWYRVDDNLGTIPAHVAWAKPLIALFGAHQINFVMALLALTVIVVLFGLQMLGMYAARTTTDLHQARKLVVGFAIAFIVIQVFMQNITSTDLYGYIARSYLIATLHQNPTISLATFLPGGYLVPHARPPAPYGPLWLLLCWLVGWLAGENLLLAMLLMKSIVALAAIGGVLLVAYLTDKLMPGQRIQSLILFAWSPLLILEAAGNGHNDMVMMVSVLGSLAMLVLKKPLWSFPLLALGVLVKYSMGILVPLWAVYVFFTFCWRPGTSEMLMLPWPPTRAQLRSIRERINWRQVGLIFGGGGALSVLIAAICYAHFWVGFKTFTGLGQQLGATYFNGSIAGTLYAALQFTSSGSVQASSSLGSAIRLSLYLIYGLYVAWQVRHLWLRGSQATVAMLAQLSGKIIFATLVLVTFWYQPWYIVWLLPFAAIAPDGILRRHAATLAFGGLLTYVVQYFTFVNDPELTRNFFVQFFLVIVAFAPLLILQHGPEALGWRAWFSRVFSGLNAFVQERTALVYRIMLGLILTVAALLRLIRLGSTGSGSSADLLHQISSNLSVVVTDARGLDKVFSILQAISIKLFGSTPFAVLLPTALIGTATVWLIAELALELSAPLPLERRQIVALLAALFAATAQWHVALSRTGAQVVVLPLLISAAALALWRGLHATDDAGQRLRMLVVAGLCVGLLSDLEPSLWMMPLLLVAVSLVIWWQRRASRQTNLRDMLALVGSTVVVGLPTIWYYLAALVGFPRGSPFLARTSERLHDLSPLSLAFWGRTLGNLVAITHVLITQGYTAAGPGGGTVPILPALLLPFVLLGVILVARDWRQPTATMVALLAALPFVIALTAVAPASVIEAATVLPIACILPALGMEAVANWLASLPTLFAGADNRIFISRTNLVRTSLLLVLVIATVSTFFWYFASTLVGPTHIVLPA
jgi:hypothetical protein